MEQVLEATAREYGVSTEEYSGFRSGAGGRDVAAYLSRRYTTCTLAEISARFGLGHPDSASELIKRGRASVEANDGIKNRAEKIEKRL